MAFSLMGLEPRAVEEYVWAGDDAVDLAASDTEQWRLTGKGLRLREGAKPVVFRWQALKDTVREMVWRLATSGLRIPPGPQPVDIEALIEAQLPVVRREAFAFAVTAIEGHPELAFRQVLVPGGLRVADEVMDALEGVTVKLPIKGAAEGEGLSVRLIQHLGRLVLEASRATEHEKKV